MGDHIEGDSISVQSVQKDFVKGDKHVTYIQYVEREIPKILGMPPFVSKIFVGRKNDLQTVHQKFFEEENMLLLLNGDGGIGKTSLAAHYFKEKQTTYKHLAWIPAGTDILNALLSLAYPLGVVFPEKMPKKEKIKVLLQEMANLQPPSILVIDNANDLKDLENVYLDLRRLVNFHILLTTRISSFEEEAFHKVEPLLEQIAISLFKTYYTDHDSKEDELLYGILEAVGFNTLVIELLAKNLTLLNKHRKKYKLANLLRDLQEKGLLQLSLSKKVGNTYHHIRREKPEKIIMAMYDLGKLEKEEQKLLSIFSVLPTESIAFHTIESLITDLPELDDLLNSLTQKGWIEHEQNKDTYKISPIVQEICKAKTENLFENCKGLTDRLIYKMDYQAGINHLINTNYEEAFLFSRYGESLHISIQKPKNKLAVLCERIGTFFWTMGNLEEALRFFQERSAISQELNHSFPENISFKSGLAISYSKLGEIHNVLGNLEEALRFYKKNAVLSQELYKTHPENISFKNGLANSFKQLGNAYRNLGHLTDAQRFFQNQTDLFHQLNKDFPENTSFKNGLATSYLKLGQIHYDQNNSGEALRLFEQFNYLAEQLFYAYPQHVSLKNNLALSYQHLGMIHLRLENLQLAFQFFQKFNLLEEELYETQPQLIFLVKELAVSYRFLGITNRKLGMLAEALQYFQQQYHLSKDLCYVSPTNVEFQNVHAFSLEDLGDFFQYTKEIPQSKEYYELAYHIWTELIAISPAKKEFQDNLNRIKQKLGISEISS